MLKKADLLIELVNNIHIMLTTIAVILLVLWLVGLVSGVAIGNFIHILLVIAVILFLVRVIRGENPLK
jgi:hypothetical protein